MQITTAGSVSGTLNYQVFPLGVGADQVQVSIDFDGAGTFGVGSVANACGCNDATATNYDADADYNDGSCVYEVYGCTDDTACNYDADAGANTDDGSCLENDECGVCGGSGIADGDCDCAGNVLDECGVCGGSGIAEGDCDCAGNVLDECGVCGGSGIAEGDCDCAGNVLDECGVCGGSGIAEGDCDCAGNVLDECGVCGGSGIAEGDCDCAGNVLDECGVCGGGGIAEGECDCAGNVLDECGVCGGSGTLGCTDSTAINYDESADCDDGSCNYNQLSITTTVCGDAASDVRMTGPWWGWDPFAGPVASDNGDGTWTFLFNPAPTADMEYLLVVDGVQENMINAPHPDLDGDGYGDLWDCTPITDYWSYANRLWVVDSGNVYNVYGTCSSECVEGCTDAAACNFNGEALVDDGSCLANDDCGDCGGDNTSCTGCMDTSACNYDPAATIQSGEYISGGVINLVWTPGSWDGEVSYEVNGETYGAGDYEINLGEGTYTVTGYDSFGDGWNGGELTITDLNSQVSWSSYRCG